MKPLAYPEGATPLDPDEVEGLRLTHITSREELNLFEAENIHAGMIWAKRSRHRDIISEDFMRKLHKRMFGDVWMWAGEFRKSNKNIGVPRESIGVELHKLCEDVKCWIEFESYPVDEIAARFHHRLVWIHPFVNGNGRHARLMADFLLEKKLGGIAFTWGRGDINQLNDCRQKYIQALRTADKGDYTLLFDFVHS